MEAPLTFDSKTQNWAMRVTFNVEPAGEHRYVTEMVEGASSREKCGPMPAAMVSAFISERKAFYRAVSANDRSAS